MSWLSNSYQKTREYFSPSCMMDDGFTETDLPCHYVGIGSRHSSASFGLVAQLVTQIKKCWHFDIRVINYRIKSMWKKILHGVYCKYRNVFISSSALLWMAKQRAAQVTYLIRSCGDIESTTAKKKVKVSRLQFRWIQLEWFIHSLNAIFSYFFCGSFLAAQHFQNKSNHKL